VNQALKKTKVQDAINDLCNAERSVKTAGVLHEEDWFWSSLTSAQNRLKNIMEGLVVNG